MKNKKLWKRILLSALAVVLTLVIVVVAYASYVFIAYYRIDDNQKLEVVNHTTAKIETGKELKAISYNIGFCAYTQDFSFFMDGGSESRAKSEESVNEVLKGIKALVKKENPDLLLLQEVDENATRSHHVNQRKFFTDNLTQYDTVFATNYDSPYLFYPIFEPHGKSLSGIMTMSKYDITSSTRRQLPVEDSVMKILDLDRCYSVSRMPTDNGKELVVYTAHLSAYTSDGTIATEQLKILTSDMRKEYEKGNYVICGGDFNKDLLIDSGKIFGVSGEDYTWAQAFPVDMLKGTHLSLVAPFNESKPVASCRDTSVTYKEKGQYRITLDGFIVSDNVQMHSSDVIDTKFKYSDHNPVYMSFTLKK